MSKQYLYKIEILKKNNSHPLEAISYYSGEHQYDTSLNKQYTSNSKDNVIWNQLFTPNKDTHNEMFINLPEYLKFRSNKKDLISNARNILWQNIFIKESKKNAQFARIFELSVPGFLTHNEAIEIVSQFSNKLIDYGMIVDSSIHFRDNNSNSIFNDLQMINLPTKTSESSIERNDYIAYLMCTLRDYKNGMFQNKNREWNSKYVMESLRKDWVSILFNTLNESTISDIEKKSWQKKLSIYSEYQELKNNFNKKLKI